jgi:hypothetical protein
MLQFLYLLLEGIAVIVPILLSVAFSPLNSILLCSTIPVKLNEFSFKINSNSSLTLNPWFITGFTDGEGSFTFSVVKSNSNKIGWAILIHFNLVAKNNPANLSMFQSIQQYFGIGQIVTAKTDNYIRYVVNGLPNCLILRDFFIKYPLLSYKLVHFKIWCAVIDLLVAKEHLTLKGLLKIIALKAHSPNGLSDKLISAFSNYIPIECPVYNPDFSKINIHWLAGFMNADGSFGLYLQNDGIYNVCRFRILITQHPRSFALMLAIKDFLGVGNVYDSKPMSTFKIFNLNEVNAFIIKFKEAQLLGAKALDYSDFCKGIDLINNKATKTSEGLAAYKQLILGMNSTRTIFVNSINNSSNSTK